MIWTLHRYLGRDLLKTALLAAAAFTLVMTTFALIEPLRKQGIGPLEALRLFWYLLPVMLSLTLPIAALFAATMVYGRFSMDNELTACRASGVSAYSLLKPALVMAGVVTLLSLTLSNWVAPSLARRGEEAGKANIEALLYQQFKTLNYVRRDKRIIHADECDPKTGVLYGVVAIDTSNPDDIRYVVASRADVVFDREPEAEGGRTLVTFTLTNPTVGRQSAYSVAEQVRQTFGPIEIPSLTKDDPAFYDWNRLCQIRDDPRQSQKVQQKLEDIYRKLHAARLFERMSEALNAGRAFELTAGEPDRQRFIFRPARAQVGEDSELLKLTGPGRATSPARGVVIEEFPAGGREPIRVYRCRSAQVQADYVAALKQTQIGVDLTDVEVARLGDSGPPMQRADYSFGPLDMPEYLRQELKDVTLADLYNHSERFPGVSGPIDDMRDYIRNTLKRKILAEMHARVAYGAGCFLLVALGGGLGLIFRGGQILSAFATICAPAMVLVVLTIMGKQLIGNPGVPMGLGFAAIWGGVAILLVLTGYVYLGPLRR